MNSSIQSLIDKLIQRCKQIFTADKLSLTSRKLYLADIKKFLIYSSDTGLTGSALSNPKIYEKYLTHLKQNTSPASYSRSLAALKQLGRVVAVTFGTRNPIDSVIPSASQAVGSGEKIPYDKYIKYFTNYLNASHLSSMTIKSYKSDITRYLQWASKYCTGREIARLLTPKNIENYLQDLTKSKNIASSTIERKSASIARFTEWYQNSYPTLTVPDKIADSTDPSPGNGSKTTLPLVESFIDSASARTQRNIPVKFSQSYTRIFSFGVLISLLFGLLYFGYRQLSRDRVTLTQAYPSTPVTPNRQLSFQGRLEDSSGTPITSATNLVFKLFDNPTVGLGTQLYTSGTCSITPDSDGIFSTQIGSTCGSAISSSVFTENANVYLEVTVASEVLSPRQQIATVAYALNSETLQGFPISSTVSAIKNTVVPMNQWGEVIIGEQSPRLTGVAGTFQISAPSLSLITATGTNGNITLAPDGTGQVNVNGNTTSTNFFSVSNAQLTTGSLISGSVANANSGFKLLDLLSGSSPTSKFSVTAAGNTTMAGDLTISGDDLFMGTNNSGYLLVADGTNFNPTAVSGDITLDGSGVTAIGADKITEAMLKSVNTATDEYCLSYESSVGDFEWQSCASGAAGSNWRITNGAISPINDTLDLLVGSVASASAKFAVLNVSSGTPTASVSAGTSGSTFLTANGYLSTTQNQSLTLGNSGAFATTGNILMHPNGTGNVGIGTTNPTRLLDLSRTSGTADMRLTGSGANVIHQIADEYDINYTRTSGSPIIDFRAVPSDGTSNADFRFGLTSGSTGANRIFLYQPNGSTVQTKLATSGESSYINSQGGNLGIGTTGPDAKLDSLSTTAQQLRLTYTDGSVYSGFTLDSSGNLTIDNTGTRTIIADDFQITGDDLFMTTNTAGFLLIADGTNFNPTAVSGDITLDGSGVTAIGADKITEAMLKSVNTATDEYCLSYESSVGDFEWQTCGSGGGGSNWRIANGAISPVNDTLDLLVGSTATASAKFAVVNVNSGTPTASVSAGTSGSTFLTANGYLSTSQRQSLTLGNSATYDMTGNILLHPTGSQNVGIGTANPTTKLHVVGDITGNQFVDSANSAYFIDPAATSTSMNVAGDIYVASGVSTFGTAVSDDTVEATQFCVGDGETNCATSFTPLSYWTDGGAYLYPTSGEVLGNAASGGGSKIAGLYLADSSPLVFGTDNDFTFSFDNSTSTLGSTLTAGTRLGINTTSALATLDIRSSLGTIPVASISGNTSMASLIVDQTGSGDIFTASSSGMTQFVVKKNGNVGIGVSDPSSRLQIGGTASTISNSSGDITIDSAGGSIVFGTDDDLIPTLGAGTATLGSDLLRWDDLYLSASSLHIGTSTTDEGVISYNTSSNILTFSTDSTTNADISFFTDDMYLDKSSGFVGIGLTNPSTNLDVADSMTITGLTPTLRFNETDNLIWQYIVTGDQWIVQRNGADRMVVNDTGTLIMKGHMYNNEDTAVMMGAAAASSTLQLLSNNTINAVLTDLGKFGIGNTNPVGKLDVNGAVTGKALAIFNETGDQDIIVASASGTTRFRVANDGFVYGVRFVDTANSAYYLDPASTGTSLSIDGNIVGNGAFYLSTGNDAVAVSIGTSGAGKLDAGTIDPPYTINGEKFATYMTSMTGVKEETTGFVDTSEYISGIGYRSVINFGEQEKGSDLWLFTKVSDLKSNISKLVVLLSPMGNTKAWYQLHPETGTLEIYTNAPARVSYRLTAPRFDHDEWGNTRTSESTGFTINSSDEWGNTNTPLAVSPNFDIEAYAVADSNGEKYTLVDQAGHIIRDVMSASQAVVANLRAGLIETRELKTDLISPLTAGAEIQIDSPVTIAKNPHSAAPELTVNGEIDATTVSARTAQLDEIRTNKLYADEIVAGKITAGEIEGLDARIASLSASPTQTLTDSELDSITDRIKSRIALLTGDTPQAADLPAPIEASESAHLVAEEFTLPDIASDSGTLATLDAGFVTINNYLAVIGQATITSLDVTSSLYSDSISSKSDVLAIQPLGGSVKLAAGTLIVDSSGEVAVNGNLTVSGSILADSAEFNSLSLGSRPATESAKSALGQLLAVYNEQGQTVATIDASGSATLAGVTTQLITIAAGKVSTPSGLLSSAATSNATAGESILVSPDTELTIESSYVTAGSLVYLTPTTNTDNKVLFVKSKVSCQESSRTCKPGFTVAIDSPAGTDISFNWWIIQLDKKE